MTAGAPPLPGAAPAAAPSAPRWPDHATVAVIGGGTAGCATALSLARQGIHDVVVVEAGTPRAFHVGETIPPAAGAILRRLDLWPAFAEQGHVACPGSSASWGKPDLGHNDFIFDPHGRGWHLDRAAFDRMLADAATARGHALFRETRLRAAEPRPGGGYDLRFETRDGTGHRMSAGFLVDATGAAAGAARRLGVARNELDCLIVLVAVLDLADPGAVPGRTVLEAAETGWWYAARIPGDRLIVALSTDRPTLGRAAPNDPAAWISALRRTRHVAGLLERGAARLPGGGPDTLSMVPAPSAILSRVVGRDWLAVGDAASSYDPITAQGITKALTDGEQAGAAIAAMLRGGGEQPLLAYQDGVFARFNDYVRLRHHLYAQERRWPEAGFWRRR